MPDDGAQRPEKPPEYKVYRSRRGLLLRLRSADPSLSKDGEKQSSKGGGRGARLPWRRGSGGAGAGKPGESRRIPARRVLKWVGIVALGWIALSFLAFAVSAQIQSYKLSGEAKGALHGNPFILPSAQTILVLGTDARPPDTKEPGAPHSQKCFEQQSHGDPPTMAAKLANTGPTR